MSRLAIFAALVLLLAACGEAGTDPEKTRAETPATPTGLAALDAWIERNPARKEEPNWRLFLPCPLWDVELDAGRKYLWKLDTNRGEMTFELFTDLAPKHALNVAYLSRIGYFDGLTFHRIIPGFMAQGGCPQGDGRAGPGYEFNGEFARRNPGHEARGMLSTANAGPGTDGSQFFITFAPQPRLDGKHTVFGRLVQGEEALARIEKVATPEGTPTATIRIEKAEIVETAGD